MASLDLIERYLAYLREESCSPNTIDDRRRTLTVLDRELPYGLEAANAEELKGWIWRDGLSPASRQTYHAAIHSFYVWASEAGHLSFDPSASISRPKVPMRLPRPVSDEVLMLVLANAREPYLTWVKLAAWAGMRCMDIANQLREDITEETIVIRKSKGAKSRVVPTHPMIWEAVCDLPSGPLTEHDAEYISTRTVNYFISSMGLKGVSLHRFRHWFGTEIQKRYKDLRVTQELLGHASPATTAGYALVAATQTRAAVGLLPSFPTVTHPPVG